MPKRNSAACSPHWPLVGDAEWPLIAQNRPDASISSAQDALSAIGALNLVGQRARENGHSPGVGCYSRRCPQDGRAARNAAWRDRPRFSDARRSRVGTCSPTQRARRFRLTSCRLRRGNCGASRCHPLGVTFAASGRSGMARVTHPFGDVDLDAMTRQTTDSQSLGATPWRARLQNTNPIAAW